MLVLPRNKRKQYENEVLMNQEQLSIRRNIKTCVFEFCQMVSSNKNYLNIKLGLLNFPSRFEGKKRLPTVIFVFNLLRKKNKYP